MAKRRKRIWEYGEFEPIEEEEGEVYDYEEETPLSFWEEQELLRELEEPSPKKKKPSEGILPPPSKPVYIPPPYELPPPPKEARQIRMVAWDLDDTLWYVHSSYKPPKRKKSKKKKVKEFVFKPKEGMIPVSPTGTTRAQRGTGIISGCGSGYRRVNKTTIENDKCRVVLKPGVLDTLKKLKKRGIYLTTASLNNFKDGIEALRAFGLADMFVDLQIGWGRKDKMIRRSLDNLRNRDICIRDSEIMFLDDNRRNLEDVHKGFEGKPIVLNSEMDYRNANEIFKWIKRG